MKKKIIKAWAIINKNGNPQKRKIKKRFELYWTLMKIKKREIPKDPKRAFSTKNEVFEFVEGLEKKLEKRRKYCIQNMAFIDRRQWTIKWIKIWGDNLPKPNPYGIRQFVASFFGKCAWKDLILLIKNNISSIEFKKWVVDLIWRIERTKTGEGYRCINKFYESQIEFLKWYINNDKTTSIV